MEEIDMEASSTIIKASSLKKSIGQFQKFMGLPVTGKPDKATLKMMGMPRCGVKDLMGQSGKRKKRFDTEGSTWEKRNITYRINKYPTKLKRDNVDSIIRKAFDLWAKHAEINFESRKNSNEKVDMDISFITGKHGDDTPFEGPEGVLAHAFFPKFGGDVHFDDSEEWTIDSPKGINLLQVANHEIGHALGLLHSDELDSSMSPLYNDFIPNFMLHTDDVQGIQKLYGKRIDHKLKKPPKTSQEIWDDYWENLVDY
ncbi:matrilysin-like isoform X2 [Harmonia axyridis]|nr:matrilysin-like isoform X2 [Harmonia axyridis]